MPEHQVFISYRSPDRETAQKLQTVLEKNGIRCWMDSSGLRPSDDWSEQIARAIAQSRALVLLVTDSSMVSPREQKRELSVAEKYQVRVVPVYVTPPQQCPAFDYLLGNTQHMDASVPPLLERLEQVAGSLRQLLAELELERLKVQERAAREQSTPAPPLATAPVPTPAAGPGKSVAILYRRNVAEDEQLIARLEQHLTGLGHKVFLDKHLPVGAEWRRTIREKVENADAVIPILSMFSIGSEMLEEEIQIASRRAQESKGRPLILPVRVRYEGPLPAGMETCLQKLQYVLWDGEADTERVLQSLSASLSSPPVAPVTAVQQREVPVGAVPLTSPFYIERPADRIFTSAIEHRDSIVLVKGARQMGKTSLIARGLQAARRQGWRVAVCDMQTLNERDFSDIQAFYTALADSLAAQLDLDTSYEPDPTGRRAPNTGFERFIKRDILQGDGHVVIALDEVDRLFPCGFSSEVFGLFRSWHNARALDPDKPWSRLTLVIGFATEASLFIKDVNQSPFNVGTRLALDDFSAAEVEELNARYGLPLHNRAEVDRLMALVGGQPFLVRRSLYSLSVEGLTLDQVLEAAATDRGIFWDHLRRFYISLHKDQGLEAAVRAFIRDGAMLDPDSFHRLHSAGLIVGEVRQEASIRCGIYGDYLRRHLA